MNITAIPFRLWLVALRGLACGLSVALLIH
jgi:hypothetical protein